MWAWCWLASAWAAPPLQVTVPKDVDTVVLDCAGKRLEARPVAGVATFAEAPASCKVLALRPIGQIAGPGEFTCDDAGCKLEETHHLAISDGPGRLNVVMTGAYDTKWLELTCSASGYRVRADIVENTATFTGVPAGDCALYYKGATPAQYRGISSGSWRCSLTGTTAVCARFTP